jgi:hypothetical protein
VSFHCNITLVTIVIITCLGSISNEVTTVNFLVDHLMKIKATASSSAVFEVEVQRSSSNFYFDFLGGITNVRTIYSILNSHFLSYI